MFYVIGLTLLKYLMVANLKKYYNDKLLIFVNKTASIVLVWYNFNKQFVGGFVGFASCSSVDAGIGTT